jgi:hypothetical protein
MATAANIAKFEAQRHELEAKANAELAAAQARAVKFENFKLELKAKAGRKASCSDPSAPRTLPKPRSKRASPSAAAKCACRPGRFAPPANIRCSCICTLTLM